MLVSRNKKEGKYKKGEVGCLGSDVKMKGDAGGKVGNGGKSGC